MSSFLNCSFWRYLPQKRVSYGDINSDIRRITESLDDPDISASQILQRINRASLYVALAGERYWVSQYLGRIVTWLLQREFPNSTLLQGASILQNHVRSSHEISFSSIESYKTQLLASSHNALISKIHASDWRLCKTRWLGFYELEALKRRINIKYTSEIAKIHLELLRLEGVLLGLGNDEFESIDFSMIGRPITLFIKSYFNSDLKSELKLLDIISEEIELHPGSYVEIMIFLALNSENHRARSLSRELAERASNNGEHYLSNYISYADRGNISYREFVGRHAKLDLVNRLKLSMTGAAERLLS